MLLTHTGLPRNRARFQARSAFTSSGFTTRESEEVVNNPVRRKIISLLMLLGGAGTVTVFTTLVLTMLNFHERGISLPHVLVLVLGLMVLWIVASNQWVDRHFSNLVNHLLKRYTKLEVRDYASCLHIAGEYRVVELQVEPQDWLADRSLEEVRLSDEGILVLGITRSDGTYIGAPSPKMKIVANDVLTLYGRVSTFEKLDERRKGAHGDAEHQHAVKEYNNLVKREQVKDPLDHPNLNPEVS
ncbi:MAG: TrkA C-terminal domain-containing protein [Candidatus Euphemobacter frigidus]|nr:TrkA C-terminal domain-containing protein [Candidatus Euphemobacter frigidus]MDP8276129.1 TrkA C-terminal domain-containing protein [Candidatus Euphemobacter frigidus]